MVIEYIRQQDFTSKSLRAHGCGLAACENALRKASGGAYRSKNISSAARYRLRQSGATTLEFNKRGLTSRETYTTLDAVRATAERMDLKVKAYHGGKMLDMLTKMREVNGVLLVAVKNRVLVRAGKAVFKGFNGGHWGAVLDWDGDPDGFVTWIAGEKKPIRLSVKTLIAAAGQFGDNRDIGLADHSWGDGQGEAILVGEWRTWKAGYGDMKDQRDVSNRQVELLADKVAALEIELAACQAGTPVEP